MYKYSVPVMNEAVTRTGREETLALVRRFGAERIFLALDCYETDVEKRREALMSLAENCRFFKEAGLEVGAWIWTFMFRGDFPFTHMETLTGQVRSHACPLDDAFVQFAEEYIRDIAKTGVDAVMFDDDFRYGFLGDSPACLCPRHTEEIERRVGKKASREEIAKQIAEGGKNPWRDAYLAVNGDSFRNFAKRMRAALDEVAPQTRMGACACMTAWDVDGVSAGELARILAGNTKPFVRLIGAPYWATRESWGNGLCDVIELERMESAWTREEGLELMAEGDAYPRPRYRCPASYLEAFDTAIRASGVTDGILKYGVDYHSSPAYETGYAAYHERNLALYPRIDGLFGGKTAEGVRIYEYPRKAADAVPDAGDLTYLQAIFFSQAARTLARSSVPTVYEGEGIGAALFGENARQISLDALPRGLILDGLAAKILSERGVDVGAVIGAPLSAGMHEKMRDGERVYIEGVKVYGASLKEGAELLSDTETKEGWLPLSYRYENAAGQRFLVICAKTDYRKADPWSHYARSRQYADMIPWLSRRKLPAYVHGHPGLYVLCKRKGDRLAVGLWNLFADAALSPRVELDGWYSDIRFIAGDGFLTGDCAELEDIPAFGFAAFEVTK